MANSVNTKAVILRYTDTGEADRIYELFTDNLGRISATGKNVRQSGSRRGGHLQLFNTVSLKLSLSQNGWYYIQEVSTEQSCLSIQNNERKMLAWNHVLKFVGKYTSEMPDEPMFTLLNDTIRMIDSSDNPNSAVLYFDIHFFTLSGYTMQLQTCTHCNKEIKEENQFYSAESGGVICPTCHEGTAIDSKSLAYLRFYQRSDMQTALKHPIPDRNTPAIGKFLKDFCIYYLH